MTMKFIGNDKDILTQQMGFVHGETYDVRFVISNKMIFLLTKNSKGRLITCPYNSIEVIFKNWEMIK